MTRVAQSLTNRLFRSLVRKPKDDSPQPDIERGAMPKLEPCGGTTSCISSPQVASEDCCVRGGSNAQTPAQQSAVGAALSYVRGLSAFSLRSNSAAAVPEYNADDASYTLDV